MRLARAGETARLAAILGANPDGVDILAGVLLEHDDRSTVRLDFVDEVARILRYRIVSDERDIRIELGYSDHALWLRGFSRAGPLLE